METIELTTDEEFALFGAIEARIKQIEGYIEKKFSDYMKKTMLENGWSESDADKMVARAIRKDVA